MPHFFTACMLGCLLYAMIAGGAPERITVVIILTGSALSPLVQPDRSNGFVDAELGVLAIDMVDQVLMTVVALRANRFWPIPAAAIHVLPIMVHVTKVAAPGIERHVYSAAQGFETYVVLALIAIGTWRHRVRLRTHGEDRSWST